MDKIIYDNGSFYVYQYEWFNKRTNEFAIAYGIRRTGKTQDGMIFSHTNKEYTIKIADDYKAILE